MDNVRSVDRASDDGQIPIARGFPECDSNKRKQRCILQKTHKPSVLEIKSDDFYINVRHVGPFIYISKMPSSIFYLYSVQFWAHKYRKIHVIRSRIQFGEYF